MKYPTVETNICLSIDTEQHMGSAAAKLNILWTSARKKSELTFKPPRQPKILCARKTDVYVWYRKQTCKGLTGKKVKGGLSNWQNV